LVAPAVRRGAFVFESTSSDRFLFVMAVRDVFGKSEPCVVWVGFESVGVCVCVMRIFSLFLLL